MKKVKFASSIVLIALTSTLAAIVTGGSPLLFAGILFALGVVKYFVAKNVSLPTNLAYDFIISDTTYAGEAAAGFAVKAITENETVQRGLVYVQDGIKKQFTIPRFDANYEDMIQDRAATPISKGDMTIDGKTLAPKEYMIYTEFNPRDFEQHWKAVEMGNMILDRALPQTAESMIAQELIKRHNRFFNKFIWNANSLITATTGSAAIYRYTDGLIRRSFAASSGTDQTNFVASPTTLTNANIVTELEKGYQLTPVALRYNPTTRIFCSYATYDLYRQYQQAQTTKGIDVTQQGVKSYNGLPLEPIPDFPANTYLIAKSMATPESNLWIGLNSMEDVNFQMNKVSNASELWFFKLNMKVDTQIGWCSETVYYGGTPTLTP